MSDFPAPLRWRNHSEKFTAADAYADLTLLPEQGGATEAGAAYFESPTSGPLAVVVACETANIGVVQLLGCDDPDTPDDECDVVVSDTDVPGNGAVTLSVDLAHWPYYRLQGKRKTSGQSVILTARVVHKLI